MVVVPWRAGDRSRRAFWLFHVLDPLSAVDRSGPGGRGPGRAAGQEQPPRRARWADPADSDPFTTGRRDQRVEILSTMAVPSTRPALRSSHRPWKLPPPTLWRTPGSPVHAGGPVLVATVHEYWFDGHPMHTTEIVVGTICSTGRSPAVARAGSRLRQRDAAAGQRASQHLPGRPAAGGVASYRRLPLAGFCDLAERRIAWHRHRSALDLRRRRLTLFLIRREVVPWLRHSCSAASSWGCTT